MSRKRKSQDSVEKAITTRSFTDIAELTAGMEHLRVADDRLVPLIESFGAPERLMAKDTSCFRSLAKSIVYQQLAGSAAAAIYARFLSACGVADESQLTPAAVLGALLPSLRACGLSERKASYLIDLAAHFEDGRLSDQLLTSVSDAELLERLTAVRGIGPWTVDMFAMFHLGHPNILPVGDLGVRKGLAHLCGLKHLPSPAEMQEITAAWQPYRSLGCYYMWRIPLPPSSRQTSKASNGIKSKASKAAAAASRPSQQAYRSPAPAFPLGGAVPAVADVGVNPLSPVLAVAFDSNMPNGVTPGSRVLLQPPQAAAAAADGTPGQDVVQAVEAESQQELPGDDITPMKPLAAAAAAAAGGSSDQQQAEALHPLLSPQAVPPESNQGGVSTLLASAVVAPSKLQAALPPIAAAAAVPAEGVMTRRRLRWAQQAAAGSAGAGVTAGVKQQPEPVQDCAVSQPKTVFKARVVDL